MNIAYYITCHTHRDKNKFAIRTMMTTAVDFFFVSRAVEMNKERAGNTWLWNKKIDKLKKCGERKREVGGKSVMG